MKRADLFPEMRMNKMLLLLNILKKEEFGYLLKSWHPVPSLHGKQMRKQWKW